MNAGLSQTWRLMLARFAALSPRERTFVGLAFALVFGASVWWFALSPALKTLAAAPAQHAALDQQIESMQRLAVEAKAVQSAPKINYNDAIKALESSVKERFGSTADLRVAGDRATLTLKGAAPGALAAWLPQARALARAVPTDAKLVRSAAASTATGAASATWDGTVSLVVFAKP
jgi:general secretion pathway protein M